MRSAQGLFPSTRPAQGLFPCLRARWLTLLVESYQRLHSNLLRVCGRVQDPASGVQGLVRGLVYHCIQSSNFFLARHRYAGFLWVVMVRDCIPELFMTAAQTRYKNNSVVDC